MDEVKLKSITVRPDMTIKQAMKQLNDAGMRILFVVNDMKVLGTVTDGDIRRGLINGRKFGDKIGKVMFRDFIAIYHDESDIKEKAQTIMLTKAIEQIPVLDKGDRIIDVILWTDVFGKKEVVRQKRIFENLVVIMAGEKGTRLDPFTKILPKPLIPIGEKTIIEIIMEKFYNFGFQNFFLTLNYKKEYIKMFLKENNLPYKIDWVEENDFMGTAGSLSMLEGRIKDTFFVTNCDIIVDANYIDILQWHKSHNNLITLIGCHKEIKIPYGILEMNKGILKNFVEKPSYDVLINTGVYVFDPEVISLIPKDKHLNMNILIEVASKEGRVSVYPIHDGWFDLGQWDEYRKSIKELRGI